jgi:hypothetical protein
MELDMKNTRRILIGFAILFLVSFAAMAQGPWQQLTMPTVSQVSANFRNAPHEYGAIHWAIWGGPLTRERIVQEFDSLVANSIYVVNFGPARGMTPKYLSPEYFDLIKFAVDEARKRGIKVWIADEGTYPSGFAGGLIGEKFPQFVMQGIVADMRVSLTAGQTISMPLPPDTLGVYVENGSDHTTTVLPMPKDGQLKYTAPNTGSDPYTPNWLWDVVFVRHVYRSSPTRYINREDGTYNKDARYPLIDYLNPDATRAFMSTTHEVYKKLFGDQFGKTVLGFFGDETDFASAIPWTPRLLEEFQKQKGYDLQPYLPLFFAHQLTDEARRVKADYYDVWSSIFRDSFYGVQADWCAKNNMEYLVHLNGEEVMMRLTRTEGDFFRDERHVQVPGIDNLSQLLPLTVHIPDGTWDVNNNFPKLASSAAHLFGRPKVWAEEGGGLGVDGKFQLDYQLVRGVNAMQIRVPVVRDGMNYQASATQVNAPPQAALLVRYTNRAGYVMAQGRPAAQVGLYHPANSMWLGDEEADRSTTKLGWQLLEHQVDWDYFDEQSLSSVATIADGGFKNLSGQVYRAIVVPSSTVITKTGLERFQAFVKAGGKLIFVGKTPTLLVDKTFRDAKDAPDLSFATLIEPSGDITPRVLAALPKPDVKVDAEFPRLTYMHRIWADGDMYFFFNESNKEESRTVTVAGKGQTQVWDCGQGQVHGMSGATAEGDSVRFPLILKPYESKLITISPNAVAGFGSEPALVTGTTLMELDGDWTLDLNGQHLTTPLKSWQDLGAASFVGPAIYHKQITLSALPAGKRVILEVENGSEFIRPTVNGAVFDGQGWQAYRWDITTALQPGANDLQFTVYGTPGGRGGSAGAASAGAPAAGGGRAGQVGPAGSATAINAPVRTELRVRGIFTPPSSGVLGPVRLVVR